MIYDQIVEKLLERFAAGDFTDEVVQAKKEFFETTGRLNEESDQFDSSLQQFFDWYLFTRDLSSYDQPPIQLALSEQSFVEGEAEEVLKNFLQHHHSLFEFLKIKGQDIYIRDLFSKKKYILENSEVQFGFDQDELFEARIIPMNDTFVFAKGFCIHPSEAKKFILKEIKHVRKICKKTGSDIEKRALILRLAKMRYKMEQYHHVRWDYIYTNESRLKF